MANLAKFTIDGTASSPGGYDATISQVLDFALEGGPANLVQRWTLQVFDAADAGSPLASKNAPTLTLVGATSGQKVDAATPASGITCTMPGSGVHSWLIRSIVNGGVDASGNANPDYVFERFVAIKTGSGLRKIVGTEATQYGPRGWADAQNDLIDAGAGPLTAPGGAGDANKIAAASGAGTNLQYAAGIRLASSGTALAFGATPATTGEVRLPHNSSIYGRNNAGIANIPLVRWGALTDVIIVGGGTEGVAGLQLETTTGTVIVKVATVNKFSANSTGIGFYATSPVAKQAPTGSRGGNAALASLLTALATVGLITDSTSA